VEHGFPANPQGVMNKKISVGRCAVARERIGSIFHYVNVCPQVQEHEMITDVYLSLR